jgi:hypothetical protein
MSNAHLAEIIALSIVAPMAILCIVCYWVGRFDERADIRNRARLRAEGMMARKQNDRGIRI